MLLRRVLRRRLVRILIETEVLRRVLRRGGVIEGAPYSNFSGTAGISRQTSRDVPAKKFGFPGFEGHTELFGPHPFPRKTPTPPEDIRTQKFGFGFLFLA